VVVVDADGAVLVPQALLGEVLEAAVEQERQEAWIMSQVEAGVPLPGLYPPNEANKARYEEWKRRGQ
jgi:regulator of RNase E activity RraA